MLKLLLSSSLSFLVTTSFGERLPEITKDLIEKNLKTYKDNSVLPYYVQTATSTQKTLIFDWKSNDNPTLEVEFVASQNLYKIWHIKNNNYFRGMFEKKELALSLQFTNRENHFEVFCNKEYINQNFQTGYFFVRKMTIVGNQLQNWTPPLPEKKNEEPIIFQKIKTVLGSKLDLPEQDLSLLTSQLLHHTSSDSKETKKSLFLNLSGESFICADFLLDLSVLTNLPIQEVNFQNTESLRSAITSNKPKIFHITGIDTNYLKIQQKEDLSAYEPIFSKLIHQKGSIIVTNNLPAHFFNTFNSHEAALKMPNLLDYLRNKTKIYSISNWNNLLKDKTQKISVSDAALHPFVDLITKNRQILLPHIPEMMEQAFCLAKSMLLELPSLKKITIEDPAFFTQIAQKFLKKEAQKNTLPTPPERTLHSVSQTLSFFNGTVSGQLKAKEKAALALLKHLDLIEEQAVDPNSTEKPRHLIFAGPSGTGKTLLASTMAKAANVPFLTIDCSRLSPEGYKGTTLSEEMAQLKGKDNYEFSVVVLDEIDKILPNSDTHSQFRASVIPQLLTLLEGTSEISGMNTKNMLFICAGSFFYNSNIREKMKKDLALSSDDFLSAGFPPEILGRIRGGFVQFNSLTKEDFLHQLNEMSNSPIKKMILTFKKKGVNLIINPQSIKNLAEKLAISLDETNARKAAQVINNALHEYELKLYNHEYKEGDTVSIEDPDFFVKHV
jgi:ATP-dependent Clp protease ATP-binding subunit ClpX